MLDECSRLLMQRNNLNELSGAVNWDAESNADSISVMSRQLEQHNRLLQVASCLGFTVSDGHLCRQDSRQLDNQARPSLKGRPVRWTSYPREHGFGNSVTKALELLVASISG